MSPDAPLDDPSAAAPRLAPDERPRAPLAPGLRLVRMLWRVVPPAAFVVLAEAAAALLGAPEAVRRQVHVGAIFVGAWAVLRAIVLEVLSPVRPALRMVPLSDLRAVQVAAWLKVVLAFLLATELSTWLLEANGAEPGLVMAVRVVRDAGLLLFATVAILALGLLQGLRARAGGRLARRRGHGGDPGALPARGAGGPGRPRGRAAGLPALRRLGHLPRVRDRGPGAPRRAAVAALEGKPAQPHHLRAQDRPGRHARRAEPDRSSASSASRSRSCARA